MDQAGERVHVYVELATDFCSGLMGEKCSSAAEWYDGESAAGRQQSPLSRTEYGSALNLKNDRIWPRRTAQFNHILCIFRRIQE
jgi:hypothetical protein